MPPPAEQTTKRIEKHSPSSNLSIQSVSHYWKRYKPSHAIGSEENIKKNTNVSINTPIEYIDLYIEEQYRRWVHRALIGNRRGLPGVQGVSIGFFIFSDCIFGKFFSICFFVGFCDLTPFIDVFDLVVVLLVRFVCDVFDEHGYIDCVVTKSFIEFFEYC